MTKFACRNLLFDLDGTLVDSIPDLAWAADHMCRELGLPERGQAKVRQWVGNGVDKLIERVLLDGSETGIEDGSMNSAKAAFMSAYSDHCCVDSMLYPTVAKTLKQLKDAGKGLAVITNKPKRFTDRILDHFGLTEFFGIVLGADSLPHQKPSPAPLFYAQQVLGGHPCVMVGDSICDVQAARNAKMPVICTDYGYNHGQDIRDSKPDAMIHRLAELLQFCM